MLLAPLWCDPLGSPFLIIYAKFKIDKLPTLFGKNMSPEVNYDTIVASIFLTLSFVAAMLSFMIERLKTAYTLKKMYKITAINWLVAGIFNLIGLIFFVVYKNNMDQKYENSSFVDKVMKDTASSTLLTSLYGRCDYYLSFYIFIAVCVVQLVSSGCFFACHFML